MKKNKTAVLPKTVFVLVFFLNVLSCSFGQSLQHPHIWAYAADKQGILDNINQFDWAESLFNQLKDRTDSDKNAHKTNPATFLNAIPSIPGVSADRTDHTDALTVASEAAILYYLTDDEDYAQLAADVLAHYNKNLALNDSVKSSNGTGIFFNDWWLESRALYPKIAVIYDFIYDFVNDPNNTVYDVATGTRKAFDNDEAQYTVMMLCAKVFKSVSATKCNHSILANNGALFNMMMIDDDHTREHFYQRFYYNILNERKDAFTWSLSNFTAQNIWDETIGYNEGTHEFVIEAMEVLDRFKPELNVINENLRIWDGYAFYEQYFYPNGGILRYGDTGYELTLTEGYEWMLQSAKRKNLTTYVSLAEKALKYHHDEVGGYDPEIVTDRLGWYSPLQLLWGNNIADTVTSEVEELQMTQSIDHAGLVIQRNYSTSDVENYGMMYYSGGATYVHAHSSGIDLELYGKGLVMGAESGSGSYGTDEHENYRVRQASHNTVIANGSGLRGTSWTSRMNNVQLVACEPLSEGTPISTKFSFATQYINDTYNNCLQQRTNSIIRTSSTSGYYLDIFRSKGKTTNNYHDYIYHNIGDEVSLKYTDDTNVSLTTSTKYASDISTSSVTGWQFFESVKSSSATDRAVNATFDLASPKKKMHVYMPSGISHEYATALAPYTKGAIDGYASKKTPTMTLRKYGEAWDAPFVAVYEPTDNNDGTIRSVENITVAGKVVGAIVTSMVGDTELKDYIIATDKEELVTIPDLYMSFNGRFAIIRKQKQTETTETVNMYIGQGQLLTYGDITLQAGDDKRAAKEYYGVPVLNADSKFTLSTRVLGSGGKITVTPDKATYAAGEEVTVKAEPEEGYVLDEWLGDAEGNDLTYTLSFFADRSVNVRFRFGEYYYLNVASENGSVIQSVEGKEHLERTSLELTATPDARYEFIGWTGDVESNENPLTIRLDSTMNVVANFRELELYKLTVNIIGNGKVSLLPEQEEYLAGTEVTVFAQANDDDSFVNWSGDYSGTFSSVFLKMDSAITITANFTGITGLNDSPIRLAKVFPNPNNGVMTLSTAFTGEISYTISNIEGKVLHTGTFLGQEQINLDESGFYFVQLFSNGYSKTMKVLVVD